MAKGEKRARIKRLIKQRESLLMRAKEHRIKAGTEKGDKDTTWEYWMGEVEEFEKQAGDIGKILERLGWKRENEFEEVERKE